MKSFFKVMDIEDVLAFQSRFSPLGTETVPLEECQGRVLAEAVAADLDLPGFSRATMDGYAVRAASTFGASEANPAFLTVIGSVAMGQALDVAVDPGQAVRIATGGMLPEGADAVVMIEHAEPLDDTALEVYKSVAPGQHVIEAGEDFRQAETVLRPGRLIRPAELGLLAAFGRETVRVHRRPVAGIVSTGDEVVPVSRKPARGEIRDVNTYTLSGMVRDAGGVPISFGLIRDDADALRAACQKALSEADMVLVSGGSSVGSRDFTIQVLEGLADSDILAHGVSIRPGKPTILARVGATPVFGLPGHVVSAMVVFSAVVEPFLHRLAGRVPNRLEPAAPARLSRNLASAQGRVDYVRVRLTETGDGLLAEPILGKSGLIRTMVQADGLIRIGRDEEGLDLGATVRVTRL